jgi:hypothetical protein
MPTFHQRPSLTFNRQLILTKGDNNEANDRRLYPDARDFVQRNEIIGIVVAYLPGIGWPPILFQETIQSLLAFLSGPAQILPQAKI